ncbi:MAG: winged helix-turn-helix domain-containing protein [Desulfurococcales archaeon]|jgi:predicted transcriptional regulator|nr:winged helix-turn-helix domain-containing protein [Desulfurococcales archaeon]
MRKRSRARIVYDILYYLAYRGSTTITGLTYIARMPYDRLENLLRELEKKELVSIAYEGSSKKVSITEKGLKSLEDLEKAVKILEKLGLES